MNLTDSSTCERLTLSQAPTPFSEEMGGTPVSVESTEQPPQPRGERTTGQGDPVGFSISQGEGRNRIEEGFSCVAERSQMGRGILANTKVTN
jgi:hypothetical protein